MDDRGIERGWVLDVDGPLSDPERKEVTRPELFQELTLRLLNGEPVMLNTGRDVGWVYNRVVTRLRFEMKFLGLDPDELCRGLLVVGEKGGSVAQSDGVGGLRIEHDRALTVPLALQTAVAHLVARDFNDIMTVDIGKETMMSIEMRDGISLADYQPRQQAFVAAVRQLRDALGYDDRQVRVDATRIAVDLQDPRAGKGLGAARCAAWMQARGFTPAELVTVGDSASDIEMADYFHGHGFATRFVDVGSTGVVRTAYPVHQEALYETGTAAMFAADRRLRPRLMAVAHGLESFLPAAAKDRGPALTL